jgi:hypothetical protein
MGDTARFRLMADLVAERIPAATRVADVASGKGQLQAELYRRGFRNVVSWDIRRVCAGPRRNYVYGRFDHRSAPRCYEAVLGMHPDAATDQIVAYAVRRRLPFIVCPCCVLPSATRFQGVGYGAWIDHLVAMARRGRMTVEALSLPMSGRNIVLVGKPANAPARIDGRKSA